MTTSALVPGRFPVAIKGREYLADVSDGRTGRATIPAQRAQQDVSTSVGEQSLNNDDLWRRSMESWHRGAGQSSYDRADADPYRFDDSFGVDPWTQWQLSLLNETEAKLASTAANVRLVVAGSYLYVADGQTLKFTQSITVAGAATWTTVTGTPAAAITGLASDGHLVRVAYGASGIYQTTRGAATASRYTDIDADVIDFVKGRWMVSDGDDLYNVTTNAALSGIFYRGATTDSTDTAVTSKTVAYPAGTQAGDLLVAFVAAASENDPDPGEWNQFGLSGGPGPPPYSIGGFWKEALPGETSVVFNYGGGAPPTRFIVTVMAYSGVDLAVAVPSAVQTNASSVNSQGASITTLRNGSRVIWVSAVPASVTFTPPSGMTERVDAATSTAAISLGVADETELSAAPTGTATGTLSVADKSRVIMVAFAPRVAPTPLFTHSSTDFTWVGSAEGQGDIYPAGYSGDKSTIYKTQVRADGTALDIPTVAGALPDGEIVRSIYGYLGFIFIGSDKGLRMAQSDGNGNLTIGALIPTAAPVRCFEGQDRFVWFGLEDFDISRWTAGTVDGLGRVDLREATGALTPAYASDVTAAASTSTTEQVLSVVTFQNRRVFSVADSGAALTRGVYAEKANKVATGYLDSGFITFRIPHPKVAAYVDLRHRPLTGAVEVFTSTDEGAFTTRGTSLTDNSTAPTAFAVNSRGDTHELRLKLTRKDGNDNVGPRVTRSTLRSQPAPSRGRRFRWVLMLFESLDVGGQDRHGVNPVTEIAALDALIDAQTLVECQEGNTTFNAFVEDLEFVAEKLTSDGLAYQGLCVVTLKVPGV